MEVPVMKIPLDILKTPLLITNIKTLNPLDKQKRKCFYLPSGADNGYTKSNDHANKSPEGGVNAVEHIDPASIRAKNAYSYSAVVEGILKVPSHCCVRVDQSHIVYIHYLFF
jgi:hypothetical protein